ncbi:xanthine dehydrogenase accessory protein XdhC [Maritimibacter sp. DP1N21-5]|uniref:xanthine dehydrogenase accessory protein XdhC n=1 Tax=Maritimibacter sp. DP1N21-5 TaxID=2836867 RepID=UPI001C488233|nr:xanthine dehydrogenase accessory protein XdhC [Maritimibacter sp. DP1N21-5]MBV7407528.1 xanthine dehydrogenase accessory protein XdhC [Maritimibacter sp. DP1N21-5]
MSFDAARLAALIAAHGPVIRVVVAEVRGSAPREVGASVTVWSTDEASGQDGTIGGGTLEYQAVAVAREMLASGAAKRVEAKALGPDMGQCCGGRVKLLWERYDAVPEGPIHARPIAGGDQPLAITRTLAAARRKGEVPAPALIDGWMLEPVLTEKTPVWIWGAGHVGRALVAALAPLPDLAITWLDTGPERFPQDVPPGVTALPAPELAAAMRLAPPNAHHVILTYSHALDLALCDAALGHGFAGAGLIGSHTKWARFRSRLQQAGHERSEIERIRCPIGDKALGKHPAAIALGVAAQIASDVVSGQHRGHMGDRDEHAVSGA